MPPGAEAPLQDGDGHIETAAFQGTPGYGLQPPRIDAKPLDVRSEEALVPLDRGDAVVPRVVITSAMVELAAAQIPLVDLREQELQPEQNDNPGENVPSIKNVPTFHPTTSTIGRLVTGHRDLRAQ